MDKVLIQDVLIDYLTNAQLFAQIIEASTEYAFLDGANSATETEVCEQGGSQTAILYLNNGSTFVRITSNACKKDDVLYSGSIEYVFLAAPQGDIARKIVLDGYKANALSIDGEILLSVDYDTPAIANILFTARGQQLYLNNVDIPKVLNFDYLSDNVNNLIGDYYYADKGKVSVRSGYVIQTDSSIHKLVAVDPIKLMGANQDIAVISLGHGAGENLENVMVSIEYTEGESEKARYFLGRYDDFIDIDFSKNESTPPIASPLLIPSHFGTYPPFLQEITIDARGSSDQDYDYLSYEWELIKSPAYSRNISMLENTSEPVVILHPKDWGTYIIGLRAFDGSHWSEQKQFELHFGEDSSIWTVFFEESSPADGQNVHQPGFPISSSIVVQANDLDIDVDIYYWEFISIPAESQLGSVVSNDQLFQFTPDVSGEYRFAVTVTDNYGIEMTYTDTIRVFQW